MRSALRVFLRLFFALFTRLKITGHDNIPLEGGVILAINHLSIIDAPLIFMLLPRDDATALVADKYKDNLFISIVVNIVNGIWINREEADFQALRVTRAFLKNGGLIGIAPEGTRSTSGELTTAKTGVAYLAYKADVPIVPAAISGTEKAFHDFARLRRPPIRIVFGEPYTLPPLPPRDHSASLQRNTDEIMCRIAALLPQKYRGVYSDHERLGELLTLTKPQV